MGAPGGRGPWSLPAGSGVTPTAGGPPIGAGQQRLDHAGGIGVLGGTFDPPHVGHVAAAAWTRQALDLDRVLLVVAGDPWQKTAVRAVTPAADRLAMAAAACEGVEGVEVSDLEVRRSGPSYTVDTLTELGHGGHRLVLVLGADAVAALPTWHRHTDLPGLAELAIVARSGLPVGDDVGGFDPVAAGFLVHTVPLPRLDVSSTDLRERLRAGAPVDGLVPPAVLTCAATRGLYRGGP
jgi:nicotinate-nucleotide adenylyltransferase